MCSLPWTLYVGHNCISCQRSRIRRHVHVQLATFEEPEQRFNHVHVGVVRPVPESDKYKYCLIMVDRFSRWPEAIPIKGITSIAKYFFANWIADYGCPKTITRVQFESMFMVMTQLIDSEKVRTTLYHSAANRMIERWHRTLKTAIFCHQTQKWTTYYPQFFWVLGQRKFQMIHYRIHVWNDSQNPRWIF